MKKYPHIISKLFYEPLLITKEKHMAMCQVVEAHMQRVDAGDAEEPDKPEPVQVGKTCIIPVHGALVRFESEIPMSACGCGLDKVHAAIDVALSDSSVDRILFDFRSPGGAVTGIPELGRKIAGIRSIETIAFTEQDCCSGALWLAAQCQQFYATESSRIGSVGVWCAYMDISRQLANDGQNIQAISAGKYKLLGAYWRPLSDDERAMVQARVDKIYLQFKEAMGTHREISDEYMQGQVFDGLQAVEIGLVDGLVEGIDEVLDAVGEEEDADPEDMQKLEGDPPETPDADQN